MGLISRVSSRTYRKNMSYDSESSRMSRISNSELEDAFDRIDITTPQKRGFSTMELNNSSESELPSPPSSSDLEIDGYSTDSWCEENSRVETSKTNCKCKRCLLENEKFLKDEILYLRTEKADLENLIDRMKTEIHQMQNKLKSLAEMLLSSST